MSGGDVVSGQTHSGEPLVPVPMPGWVRVPVPAVVVLARVVQLVRASAGLTPVELAWAAGVSVDELRAVEGAIRAVPDAAVVGRLAACAAFEPARGALVEVLREFAVSEAAPDWQRRNGMEATAEVGVVCGRAVAQALRERGPDGLAWSVAAWADQARRARGLRRLGRQLDGLLDGRLSRGGEGR